MSEVGIAGAVIAYQSDRTGRLTLIDGHERMTFGEPFPALILDVTDEEADKLLAAFDPIGAMAEANADALAALLRDVVYQEPDLQNLVTAVSLTAQALQAAHPDVVKVVRKWNRWQHQVDYTPFAGNRLYLKPGVVLPTERDNFGLELMVER